MCACPLLWYTVNLEVECGTTMIMTIQTMIHIIICTRYCNKNVMEWDLRVSQKYSMINYKHLTAIYCTLMLG
jgi:hypothetical protein